LVQNESCRVQFEQPQCCIQYASPPSAAIERGCSIGANHAQNCRLTSSGLTTHVAIARFGIIRACFNKRSTQVFPKAEHRSNIRNAPLQFEYRRDLLRLLGGGRFAKRRTINEDAFALDDCSRLPCRPGIRRTRAIRL
jgi:hypothetical protein